MQPAQSAGGHRLRNGRFRAHIRLGVDHTAPCTIRFERYICSDEPGPLGWRPDAENTVVIVGPEPWQAPNLEAGKVLAKAMLNKFVEGGLEDGLREEPYNPPPKPVLVREIQHANGEARGLILRWQDGQLEVRIHIFAEPGYCVPIVTPSISFDLNETREWGRAFNDVIYADDLQSAEEAANHYMAVALSEYEVMLRRSAPPS